MGKPKRTAKKLSLKRETLARLDDDKLESVRGGGATAEFSTDIICKDQSKTARYCTTGGTT